MECIIYLVKEAGQDLAQCTIINSFVDFCKINSARSDEALKLIENSDDKLTDLLIPTLVAGSCWDIEHYFDKTLTLLSHEKIEIRGRAIFALGKLHYPEGARAKFCDKALSSLELSVSKEIDDNLLGNVIRSTFELYKYDRSKISLTTVIIDCALSKGEDFALYMASYLLFYEYDELPEILLDKLLSHLVRLKPTNQDSIYNIDYAVSKLLQTGKENKSIEFLEKLLIQNSSRLSISKFNQTITEIFNNNTLLTQIIVRWFLNGDIALCQAIESIFKVVHSDIPISLELSKLNHLNGNQIIFIARKVIGYLFIQPIISTSIIISLMRVAPDEKNIGLLSELLFEPLLINYPGKISDYLKKNLDCEDEKVRTTIKLSLANLDNYFNDLKFTGEIPELQPSQLQLEAARRRMSRMMSESMKKTEKESVFLSIFPKSILLYGRKIINYTYQADGQFNRTEIPLQSFGGEIEIPRIANLDPLGLDYMLRIFQLEKMK